MPDSHPHPAGQPDALLAVRELLDESPVRVEFGTRTVDRLGILTAREGARRVLVVTDPGIVAAGHAGRAFESLRSAGLDVALFDGCRENPTSEHVMAGVAACRAHQADFLVAIGGGSAMDCAKGVNLLVTCGGDIADYRGDPGRDVLDRRPSLLPLLVVPTTAGTGSEAQSFALISDPLTHVKMACGDRRDPRHGGLRPRLAILDPELSRTAPRSVRVLAGIDALSHAVETAATRVRTDFSRRVSKSAWWLLANALPRAMGENGTVDAAARADALLGAHLAGLAIEKSMLGAAHACANPLTAAFDVPHGQAVGVMLPHVVRFNASDGDNPYADLSPDPGALTRRIEELLRTGGLATRLADLHVARERLPELAEAAAAQWTAGFNPRPLTVQAALALYEAAY